MQVRTTPITIALLGSLLGGCGRANVYDMPPGQVYAKLIEVRPGKPSATKAGGTRRDVYGTPDKSVTWVYDGAHAYYECTAYLTAEGSARTSVNVGCDDKHAPAKFAIRKALISHIAGEVGPLPFADSFNEERYEYIELVDSTLDGRPYEEVRARSQVMGWPSPPE